MIFKLNTMYPKVSISKTPRRAVTQYVLLPYCPRLLFSTIIKRSHKVYSLYFKMPPWHSSENFCYVWHYLFEGIAFKNLRHLGRMTWEKICSSWPKLGLICAYFAWKDTFILYSKVQFFSKKAENLTFFWFFEDFIKMQINYFEVSNWPFKNLVFYIVGKAISVYIA